MGPEGPRGVLKNNVGINGISSLFVLLSHVPV